MSDGGDDRRAIFVPKDVADAAALPEDLDSAAVGPYAVPDVARRRKAGIVYLVSAALAAAAILVLDLPGAMWASAVAVLAAIGGYHFVAGWSLRVREAAALGLANRAVGFPVGHSSASLGFVGWRARPVWNVLMFSADEPPSQRALARIDAITGSVLETYVEDVPRL